MAGFLPNSYCNPGNFKLWISAAAETGANAYFNSALSTNRAGATANARLTIYVRVLLVKRGRESPAPTDVSGKQFAHRNWDDGTGEWEKFRLAVKRRSEDFWGQTTFCIIPPQQYRGLDWPASKPIYHLNVDCHFEMVWAAGNSDAHAIVDCYRMDAESDPGFRSYCGDRCCWTNFDIVESFCHDSAACKTNSTINGRLTGWIDGIIPLYDQIPANPQIAVAHEVGHLLGLPHVGQSRKSPDCVRAMDQLRTTGSGEGSNDASCYKGNDDYDRLNVMGQGMNLAFWNGMCWWLRLAEHTGTTLEGWKVVKGTATPRRLP
jgi:hypothetical protein